MNYWNEEELHPLVVEYQDADEERRREIEEELTPPLYKMASAQINTHRFYVWEPRDDLMQVAVMNSLQALKNFNPDYVVYNYADGRKKYASTFNYFSLVIKKALTYYTIKRKKHRGHTDIESIHITHKERVNNELEWYHFCHYVDKHIYEYIKNKRTSRYLKVWGYIKQQDYTFLSLPPKIFYREMKEEFPEETNNILRQIRNIIKDIAIKYMNE